MNLRGAISTAVAGAAIVVLTASCASDVPSAETDLRRSGVGIVAEGCSLTAQLASGVAVDRPGRVVTVAHALAGASSISVVDNTGKTHPASVVAFDKDRDLAVLHAPGLDVPALQLAPAELGAAATLTWSRDAGVVRDAVSVTKLLAVTIEDIYVEAQVERLGLEVHGDVGIGDSGGAVLSSSGDVMGIIYARSRTRDGVGFATDASEVDALLRTTSDATVSSGRCN